MRCFIKSLLYSIDMSIRCRKFIRVSGHTFEEVYNCAGKQVLECKYCGLRSVAYFKVD